MGAPCIFLSSLLLTSLLLACGPQHIPPPPTRPGNGDATGTVPAKLGAFTDTSPTGLLTKLQADFRTNSGYRTWAHNDVHWVPALKIFGASYLDATLTKSVAANATNHPVGVASVLELYADAGGQLLNGWAVLAKASTAADASGWLSYEVQKTAGQFSGAPTVYALGAQACATCHTPAPAYIIPVTTK